MRMAGLGRRSLLWGMAATVALPGCSGPPPRLYVLTPLSDAVQNNGPSDHQADPGGAKARIGGGNGSAGRALGVRPVVLPEYLDRSEIVSYSGPNQLDADGDNRWAERLPANITRVLAKNLSVLLNSDRVRILPARDVERFDCEIAVDIDQFERTITGDSVLDARWAILDGISEHVLVRQRTRRTVHVDDDRYPALVAAMNSNLAALSRDIASAVSALPRTGRRTVG